MRFAVETWAPEFGAPVGGDVLGESDAEVDVAVEVAAPRLGADRAGRTCRPRCVMFVDGVQRIDARVWVDGRRRAAAARACARAGPPASCAATAAARVVAAEVRRGVLCPGDGVEPIVTRHGDYRAYPVRRRRAATRWARRSAGCGATSRAGWRSRAVPTATCWSSTARWATGATSTAPSATSRPTTWPTSRPRCRRWSGRLAAGERTPLFRIGSERFRWSWYLRLPGPATHAWWGIVRCEAAGELTLEDAVARADLVAATLPRFASQPHNDPRAPQNLHPIAGLERELKRRLGDPLLLERALREAAAAAVPA